MITRKMKLIGGVSSSYRINPYSGKPIYLSRADGPFIYDLEQRRYIDFTVSALHDLDTLTNASDVIRSAAQESLNE